MWYGLWWTKFGSSPSSAVYLWTTGAINRVQPPTPTHVWPTQLPSHAVRVKVAANCESNYGSKCVIACDRRNGGCEDITTASWHMSRSAPVSDCITDTTIIRHHVSNYSDYCRSLYQKHCYFSDIFDSVVIAMSQTQCNCSFYADSL